MKILFLVENLYKNCGASVNIILNIINIMNVNHNIHVIYFDDMPIKEIDLAKIDKLNHAHLYIDKMQCKRRKAFSEMYTKPNLRFHEALYLISHPSIIPTTIDAAFFDSLFYKKKLIKFLEQYCVQNNIEVVIGHSFPFFCMNYVSKLKNDVIKMAIELDPYTFNYTLADKKKKHRIKQEKKCVLNLDAIFTTDLIIKDMLTVFSEQEKERLNYVQIDFPEIITKDLQKDKLLTNDKIKHSGFIDFVFTGAFYKEIRNPKYLYELFLKLPKMYRLHILGGGMEEEFADLINALGNRIVLYGWVEKNKVDEMVEEADVLLNLGNGIPNQVPSKTIEYIATGKPILNISFINNCPTERVLENYGNSLTIHTTKVIRKKDVEKIVEFVERKKGDRVPIAEILKEYNTYTDVYVANQIELEIKRCARHKCKSDM